MISAHLESTALLSSEKLIPKH